MAARTIELKPHLRAVELKRRARASKRDDPKEGRRWLALWHLHQGRSAQQAALACGLSHGWVCQVARRYNAQGVAGVQSGQLRRPGGARPTLDAAGKAALAAALSEPPPPGVGRRHLERAQGGGVDQSAHGPHAPRPAGLRHLASAWVWAARAPARARADDHARRAGGLEKKLRAERTHLRRRFPQAAFQLWVEHEARLGLKPIVRRVWSRRGKGHRPVCSGAASAYQWLYLFGFVRPKTGATEWFTVPGVSTQAMNAVPAEFARAVGASKKHRGLLVLDQAGWHVAKALVLPPGIHLFHLPAYTPELSPAEHLWPPVRRGTRQPLLLAPGRTRRSAGRPLPSTHPRSCLHPGSHPLPLVA